MLHWRAYHGQRVEHVFGAGVIALRFQRQKIVCQVAHRAFHFSVIDRERPVRMRLYRSDS